MSLSRIILASEGVALRGVALTFAFVAAVYTARIMGPEKLGASALGLAIATNIGLLIAMNQDPVLIRHFTNYKDQLHERSKFVLGVMLLRGGAWLFVLVGSIFFAIFTRYGLVSLGSALVCSSLACSPSWLLQAARNARIHLRITAIQNVCGCVILLLVLNKTTKLGVDIFVVGLNLLAFNIIGWAIAIKGVGISLKEISRSLKTACQVVASGKWLFFTGIAVYCYTRLEQPLVGALCGLHELGQFRTAAQIAGAVGSVVHLLPTFLYPTYLQLGQESPERLWAEQIRLSKCVMIAGFLSCAFAIPFLLRIYPSIFGGEYARAAVPAAILLVSQAVIAVNGIFSWGMWAMNKDRIMFNVFCGVAVISVALNVVLIPRFGMLAASLVNLFSEVVVLASTYFLCRRVCKMC